MDGRLLTFIGIAAVITITPGADMALVTRVALARGRRPAWLASCGIVSGLLVWGVASAAGISALLAASATLYTILKLAGAAYLIILGVQALVAHKPAHGAEPAHAVAGARPAPMDRDSSTICLTPRSASSIPPFSLSSSRRGNRSL